MSRKAINFDELKDGQVFSRHINDDTFYDRIIKGENVDFADGDDTILNETTKSYKGENVYIEKLGT